MQIISGTLKGLTIEISTKQKEDKDLRPTTSYSKQVLFNLLNNNKEVQTEIEGKVVLDAFAGTGAVGFEFASRGASHITFVEANEANIKQLKINTAKLGVSSNIILAFLPKNEKIKSKFDIIFLDPPYNDGKGKIVQTIKNLLQDNLLENGIIILETINFRKEILELKNQMEKKGISQNLVYERESGSKTSFFFFRNIYTQDNQNQQDKL
jgi:16S rRNA (guanine966-N2)-methyltransferase